MQLAFKNFFELFSVCLPNLNTKLFFIENIKIYKARWLILAKQLTFSLTTSYIEKTKMKFQSK